MRILFVFVFLSSFAFGQISISQLIKVAKMDEETFKTYASIKKYRLKSEENYNLSKKLSYPDRLRIYCTYNVSKTKTIKEWIDSEPEELYIHLKVKRRNKIAGAIFKKLDKLVDRELIQRKINFKKL